jgi:hypothetical protein
MEGLFHRPPAVKKIVPYIIADVRKPELQHLRVNFFFDKTAKGMADHIPGHAEKLGGVPETFPVAF